MASSGNIITKASIINDFIAAVMTPAATSSRFHTTNLPTTTTRIWAAGATETVQQPIPVINQAALSASSAGLTNPTTTDLTENTITATRIVNVCRSYAYNTTRIRRITYGMYYTVYGNGSYTQTGVPSNDPVAHASGVITGTLGEGTGLGHLTTSYLVSLPAVANTPSGTETVSAPNLNSFYANLRTAANASENDSAVIDLRICHSSCHNNCHSSRGRR